MTKAELLSKLDEKVLKDIAKNEEFSFPKTYGKRELVKYLAGMLTLEKIKEYTAEIYEKETKRTIIHETVKERGIRLKAKETTKIQFDKLQVIRELNKQKVDSQVLNAVANKMGEPIPKGKSFELYDGMSDNMLDYLNRIFVNGELDSEGRFIEFRTANFIKQRNKSAIKRIEIRKKLDKIGEIDIIGYDSDNKPLVMAECKGKRPIKDEMAKWLENTRRVYEKDRSLVASLFVTSNRLTPENLDYIGDCKDVDTKTGQLRLVKGIIERSVQYFFNDDKSTSESGKVYLSIYEVRQGVFTKVFPKE
jgi:hypothetical protein